MRRWVRADVGARLSTRSLTEIQWPGSYDLLREVDGGMATLPVLPSAPAPRDGWETHDVDGLQGVLPPGTTSEDAPAGPDLRTPHRTSTLAGTSQQLAVHGPSEVTHRVRGTRCAGTTTTDWWSRVPPRRPRRSVHLTTGGTVDLTVQGADAAGTTWSWTVSWTCPAAEVASQVADRTAWLTHAGVPLREPGPEG